MDKSDKNTKSAKTTHKNNAEEKITHSKAQKKENENSQKNAQEKQEQPEILDVNIDEKQLEIERLKEQILRSMAEYDNFRKRTARERLEVEADVTAKVITEFLPGLDNLERALNAECSDANYKKGVEMIYSSFLETLKTLGVEEIMSQGEDFDPAVHQAVQHVEDAGFESGKVAQVFQKGYKIGSKVIRFAMVAITK